MGPRHVFIIGAKSIGQYGGYETFVDRLVREHEGDSSVQYHVACKANGDGYMDESRLDSISILRRFEDGSVSEFYYHGAHAFKIKCPSIGPAVAVWYDLTALEYGLRFCRDNRVERPVFYVLTCRIGPLMSRYATSIHEIGGTYLVNPDGHEWMRAKWPLPVKKYWRLSERQMVRAADLVVCDSLNIEQYILEEYARYSPRTAYVAYGADVTRSPLSDDDPQWLGWLERNGLTSKGYYLVVGRFVPENNFETMIREFMGSDAQRDLVLVTNVNQAFLKRLERRLCFSADSRVKFVGTVYDRNLLKKIREGAWAYLHGHEVGGTNPSLLEALASTDVNLLLDVGFNREVAGDAALYWTKEGGSLSNAIAKTDVMENSTRYEAGLKARRRIEDIYSWKLIAEEYMKLWKE